MKHFFFQNMKYIAIFDRDDVLLKVGNPVSHKKVSANVEVGSMLGVIKKKIEIKQQS